MKTRAFIIVFALGLIMAFQNCGKQNMQFAPADGITKVSDNGNSEPNDESNDETPIEYDEPEEGGSTNADEYNKCLSGIDKIILNIKVVYATGESKRLELPINSSQADLIVLSQGFDIAFPEDISLKSIRLVLEKEGNKIIFENNTEIPLKIPSGSQSGVKLVARHKYDLVSDVSYKVQFALDLRRDIVRTGNGKCLLKPVFPITDISREQ